jgi:hypothetical protein
MDTFILEGDDEAQGARAFIHLLSMLILLLPNSLSVCGYLPFKQRASRCFDLTTCFLDIYAYVYIRNAVHAPPGDTEANKYASVRYPILKYLYIRTYPPTNRASKHAEE